MYKRIPVDEVEKLRIRHTRLVEPNNKRLNGDTPFKWTARGGITKVDLIIGNMIFSGEAVCSLSDNFCRRTGRKLAFMRAVRKYWTSLKGKNNDVRNHNRN